MNLNWQHLVSLGRTGSNIYSGIFDTKCCRLVVDRFHGVQSAGFSATATDFFLHKTRCALAHICGFSRTQTLVPVGNIRAIDLMFVSSMPSLYLSNAPRLIATAWRFPLVLGWQHERRPSFGVHEETAAHWHHIPL